MSPRPPFPPVLALACTLAPMIGACAGKGPSQPKTDLIASGCPAIAGEAARGASFTFVLLEDVDPRNAPTPTNDSEAVLFRFLYDTLFELDCKGRALPRRVRSWRPLGERGLWGFELARGSSQEPSFSAGAVAQCWVENRRYARHLRSASHFQGWIWEALRSRSIDALGELELQIYAPAAGDRLPELLTHPVFSIAQRSSGSWPLSERASITDSRHSSGRGRIEWEPIENGGKLLPAHITFLVRPSVDPRDLVRPDVDAFLVRDKIALRFLETTEEFRVTPLPYSRTYLLLSPDETFSSRLSREDLDELARRVALAPARVVTDQSGYRIESRNGSRRHPLAERRVVYPSADRDARAIAERISVLSLDREGDEGTFVAEMEFDEFSEALFDGREAAFVVPVFPPLPNEDLRRLFLQGAAPWVEERGSAIPLVETRAHLVSRKGLVGIVAGYDGIPRLDFAGWSSGDVP